MSDTSSSAKLDPNGDYATVRVTSGAKSIVVRYDEAHRYRRMIRHINALSVVLVLALVGCAETKEYAKAGKEVVVLCVKADAGPLLQLTGELGAAALASALHAGSPDWGALVAKAKAAGLEVGGCAFAALYHALDKEPEVAARATAEASDPRRAALEQLRAALGGGHWQLADGSVL